MHEPTPRKRQTLLDQYCEQLGSLMQRRHTERALIAAKTQAEHAARLAEQAMQEAQEADRVKTKFLGNMTHELRTPLNAIIGFSEVIQNGAQPKEMAGYARYITEAGTRLLGILNGVLDLARIEAGKVELEDQVVSVDELLQATLRHMRPLADEREITITCMVGNETIYVDPAKIIQALGNIIGNAIKFTPPGGIIDIRSAVDRGGSVLIAIRDSGCGIPKRLLEKVLEPFGQVEEHLTRENDGVGLGLPIARALLKLHDAELALASELGTGTIAEIRLPAERLRFSATISYFPEKRS
jgi:two-component system cell cycle sensor histidine kinase PleC